MPYATPQSARKWVLKISGLDLFLSYILFFPPILQTLAYPYALGILICAISLIPLYFKTIFNGFAKVRTIFFATFFLVYALISWLISDASGKGPDLMNWALGILAVISLMILASIFSHIYQKELIANEISANKFPFFTALVIYSHLILFFRFAEFSPAYNQISPPLGMFSESSHIIYITALFLFIKFFSATRKIFIMYFLASIFFVVSVGSLTGIAMLLLVAFAIASRSQKVAVLLVFTTLLVLNSFFYYKPATNLIFVLDTGINLTAAVYLSGWERAYLNMIETNLMGLGVNQFGVYGDQGSFGDIINRRAGSQVNRFDGSFMFAKLTGEFGIFSLFLTAYLARLWFKCYIKNQYNPLTLGIISSFFILYFLRSPGYVCGASVLMISVLTNKALMKHELRIPQTRFSNHARDDGVKINYSPSM